MHIFAELDFGHWYLWNLALSTDAVIVNQSQNVVKFLDGWLSSPDNFAGSGSFSWAVAAETGGGDMRAALLGHRRRLVDRYHVASVTG